MSDSQEKNPHEYEGGYALRISGEWPQVTEPEVLCVSIFPCEKDGRFIENLTSLPWNKHMFPEVAHRFISRVVEGALNDGYVPYFELSRGAGDGWPRRYETVKQCESLLHSAVSGQNGECPYPISLWFVSRLNEHAEGLISVFRKLPYDDDIYMKLIDSETARLTITDIFGDFAISPSNAALVIGWLQRATHNTPDLPIYWEIRPEYQ